MFPILNSFHLSYEAEMANFNPVASYNWTEGRKSPTILVPESSAIWNNPKFPLKLQADSGQALVDQDKYRCPECPLLPIIEGVQHMDPDFNFGSVDIVKDRNNLRKLLRWLSGERKEFRIDCERIGDSLVLQRWESRVRGGYGGYGHAFELAATDIAPGCEGSTGHHRIVTYEIDGLQFLVRFEVEAGNKSTDNQDIAEYKRDNNEGDVVLDLAGLSLSKRSDGSLGTSGGLQVKTSLNPLVPHSTMIEMKTRSVGIASRFNWGDIWPQLYLSQTKHIYLSFHKDGIFEEVRTLTVDQPDSDMAAASHKTLRLLQGLVTALKKLSALTWSREVGERCSLVYYDGTVSVYTREKHVLPPETRELFQ